MVAQAEHMKQKGCYSEESKETGGFATGASKGDSVPFGTRLSMESLVCYTFAEIPAAGNRVHYFTVRSVSGFYDVKDWPALVILQDSLEHQNRSDDSRFKLRESDRTVSKQRYI